MILTKRNIYFKILFFIYIYHSCDVVNQPLVRRNEILESDMNEFSNDSLRLKVKFYGNTNLGDQYIKLGHVKRVFKKGGLEFPRKNIVLWGTYHSSINPTYLVGSLQNDVDVSTYQTDTSLNSATYYYKIWHKDTNMISEVKIPYNAKTFLNIKEIKIGVKNDDQAFKDVHHHIKTIFSSLAYGKNYVKTEEIDYFSEAESSFKNKGYADYLTAKNKLENLIMTYGDTMLPNELLKSYRSFLGESVKYDDSPNVDIDELTKISVSISDIIKRIKDHQVVMFNESHLSPRCRLLINLLLPQLYKEGFRVLALEGMSEDEKRINKEGFPNIESGFYTREPNMANLIRTAKKNGYNIIGYEDFENTKDRDLAQAQNLIKKSKIIKGDNVKIIVLAGGGHINESDEENNRSMAKYFKNLTDIDPFTVNQVKFLTTDVANDSIFIVDNQEYEGYDLYLSNNLISKRILVGDNAVYKTHHFLTKKNDKGKHSVIYVYDYDEYLLDKSAIPLYVSYSENKEKISIDFQKGKYIFINREKDGDIIQEEIFEIQ